MEALARRPSGGRPNTLTAGLYPVLHRLAPKHTTTTQHIGRAMLAVTRQPVRDRVLFSPDINRLGA